VSIKQARTEKQAAFLRASPFLFWDSAEPHPNTAGLILGWNLSKQAIGACSFYAGGTHFSLIFLICLKG